MLPKVSEYMDVKVHALQPSIDIWDAVSFLLEHKVTGAPVVDADNNLVGILSETDCLTLLSVGSGDDRPKGTVADFMTSDVISVSARMDIYYVAGLFLGHTFRRLPVVDGDGKLMGAITRFDVLRSVKTNLEKGTVREG